MIFKGVKMSQRLHVALFTYIVCVGILIMYPPQNIKNLKGYIPFGIGHKKTLLPFWLILIIIAIISYIVSLFLHF